MYKRGIEADRFKTDDEDALLYRVFIGVTQQMAIGEAMGREDYHTAFWAHQSALLGKLDPGWQERAEADRAQAEAIEKLSDSRGRVIRDGITTCD